jgi:adenylate cyclase
MNREAPTHIRSFFEEQFTVESIRREIQRAGVLFGIFVSSLFIILIADLFLPLAEVLFHQPAIARILTGFMLIMALYEFFIWSLLRYRLKHRLIVPEFGKFINGTAELLALSFVLFLLSEGIPAPILVMQSPLAMGYFLFITLSTLRLNFYLSVYTGLLSAILFILWASTFCPSPIPNTLTYTFKPPPCTSSKGPCCWWGEFRPGTWQGKFRKASGPRLNGLKNKIRSSTCSASRFQGKLLK